MSQKDDITLVRGIGFVAGILRSQQNDPLCRKCKSYRVTTERAKKALEAMPEMPEGSEFGKMLSDARSFISSLELIEEPVPQRKVGACNFPDKKCAVKHAYKVFKELVPED